MAKREVDTENPNLFYDSGENGRAAFKSKFKSRFSKNDRHNLFMRLEREERRKA